MGKIKSKADEKRETAIKIGQGKRLRKLRKDNMITQDTMSESLGIEKTTLQRYERGEIAIPVYVLKQLREDYGFDLNYILADHKSTGGLAELMDAYKNLPFKEKCEFVMWNTEYMGKALMRGSDYLIEKGILER